MENYFRKNFYGSDIVSIPRYILVGKSGKILNNNLPRPTQQQLFEDNIANLLKKEMGKY
jgi:hypothetical protein